MRDENRNADGSQIVSFDLNVIPPFIIFLFYDYSETCCDLTSVLSFSILISAAAESILGIYITSK